MIAGEDAEVGIDAEQLRIAGESHTGLLVQLAAQRRLRRLHAFDAAAGKMPAGMIGVANKQNAAVGIDHGALRTHGQSTGHAPVALQELFCEDVLSQAAAP